MRIAIVIATTILISGFNLDRSARVEDKFAIGQILTSKGEILLWLYDETPKHKEAFIKLAREGYWDSYSFNRVIKNFVAQGGCPDTPEGFAGSPYLLRPEFHDSLRHVYGALGAGRDDNQEKLSATCQFYIVHNKKGLPRLDGDYTIYGQVIKGMEVVDEIVSAPTDKANAPLAPINLDINIVQLTAAELKKLGFRQKL